MSSVSSIHYWKKSLKERVLLRKKLAKARERWMRIKFIEVRQQAMEKLSDTQKRKEATGTAEQDKRTTKKSRRSGSEAIEFLRNQSEQEWRVKEWEIEYER